MRLGELQMNKKEWEEHCKWLDTFRGKIIDTNNPFNEDYGKKEKKNKKKKTKKSQWLLYC